MSILMPSPGGMAATVFTTRAYNDPVIFRDDRVLKTLLRKEAKYLPITRNYFLSVQSEIKPHMRKEVADWMLEVCEDQNCNPEVFTLAMNYLDRFLSVCRIGRSQLQLLGAVCLMVAWKVREHEPLPAARLVEYSDYNLTPMDIMEWEVLLLSKLDWDMSAVIAFDFVEHIIQRVGNFYGSGLNTELVRRHSETLITMCSAHYIFSSISPCLIAAACVLTTLRPFLEAGIRPNDTSAMSETQSSCSSVCSTPGQMSPPDMEQVLEEVEKMTYIAKECVRECIEQIEVLMHASLPPSPSSSHQEDEDKSSNPRPRASSDGPAFRGRRLFATALGSDHSTSTPTKILDVARDC